MNGFVIDASAAVEYLLRTPLGLVTADILGDSRVIAPELLLAETMAVLRKMWLTGALDERRADMAVEHLADWPIGLISHRTLVRAAWRFRHSVSGYDAFYAAAAGMWDIPLLTADGKLARASGLDVTIQNVRTF